MPCTHRRMVLLIALLIAAASLAAGCEVPAAAPEPVAATPTTALPAATSPPESAPTEAPPTAEPPEPTMAPATATPLPPAPTLAPTEAPEPIEGDLGLGAGAGRLAAALGVAQPCSALRFAPATVGGQPALVGISPDGSLIVEIIGPDEKPTTASLAALLPEGDKAAQETARAALYQLIQVAMPERAWARAWLDERVDDALEGTPYSGNYEDYYVQVVRLRTPQPCITMAVTLDPRSLGLPTWEHLGATATAAVDTTWDRLPIMPRPLRGQRLPTEGLELYEYTVNAAAADVETFYAREMAAQGWTLDDRAVVADPAAPGQQQIVLVYRRGAEGALVTIDRFAALQETLVTLGYAEDAADLPAIAG